MQQLCYLKAVVRGERSISSTETMHLYGITSPTSASRSKATLVKRDILDRQSRRGLFPGSDICLLVEEILFYCIKLFIQLRISDLSSCGDGNFCA